ncbi:cellular nucleic acid-binding protein, partial [Trifolium medium]|nr:cellular nucleic acid-binding protein [Trifolium medium]
MGSKKKSAKKIDFEEDAANSSITAISDDDEEANKDLSLEIIQKALLNRSTNLQNG